MTASTFFYQLDKKFFHFPIWLNKFWKIQNHLITNVTQLFYRNFYRVLQMLDETENFSFLLYFANCFCQNLASANLTLCPYFVFIVVFSYSLCWVFSTESQSDNWKFWVWVRFSLPVKSGTGRSDSGSGGLRQQQPLATAICHDLISPIFVLMINEFLI